MDSYPTKLSLILVLTLCAPVLGDDARRSAEQESFRQFRSEIFPLMMREVGGCMECHGSESTSPLVMTGDAKSDFRRLLDEQYLSDTEGDTLLGRLTSKSTELRMPKDADPWTIAEVAKLREFLRVAKELQVDSATDEQFPRSLLAKFHGEVTAPPDNQFITYRQLRGKITVIFEDDWVRGDRDLFAENVSLFGGADFKTRFDESHTPRASFLTGMEMLSRDVASRAHQLRQGPFRNWPESFPTAFNETSARNSYARAVQQLYQRVLYRSASDAEVEDALTLIRDVHQLRDMIATRDTKLLFELTATDPVTGMQSRKTIEFPVSGERLNVTQTLIDQSVSPSEKDRATAEATLGEFDLSPDIFGQRFVLHNVGTLRNVSFVGLVLRNIETDQTSEVNADDPRVNVDGAWEPENDGEVFSYEDKNRHKALSIITVSLDVETAGTYEVSLRWKSSSRNATNVLTEVFSGTPEDKIAATAPEVDRTESGDPCFYYDCGNDTVPYAELPVAFQFDEESFVEISNRDTQQTVTAAGIEFREFGHDERHFFFDSLEADGSDDWQKIDKIRFNAYNVKGQRLSDGNEHKGELSLRYHPATHDDRGWDPQRFYRVRIFYPGKRDQETRVPVVIHAKRSAPIIRLSHPLVAKADATISLDAAASETIQPSSLKYTWKQLSGPRAENIDGSGTTIEFRAPRQSADDMAWTSLCAALIRHPDFLFIRPPSMLITSAGKDRRRLQLLRIALDLVGRPPTDAEIAELRGSESLDAMVKRYLDSNEFRDFYFHRIRLYLESQGSTVQDEPARLWSYIAFQDRPFQEILTADYTVTEQFRKQARPEYHGKTGLLTAAGFIAGKPGLPHYNYAAQVSMLFLGHVYEVPPEIVEQRVGITALGTTDPNSVCYSCHKLLTPLAFQRLNWSDEGVFRIKDEDGLAIDASDRGAVPEYAFKGNGMEAFATLAVRKERFIRTMINAHVHFYFGRPLRHLEDERTFYKRLWDNVHENDFKIRELIRAIMTSPEYLEHGNS